jgi:hypothetical protein
MNSVLAQFGGSFAMFFTFTSIVFSQSDNIERWERLYPKAIEDNSFLVEEAFNQEPSTVQYIFHASYFREPFNDLEVTLTNEWPLWGQAHQFSYDIPYVVRSPGAINGIGNVTLNYRYQLLNKENGIAVTPRISISLPIGNESNHLCSDHVGYEVAVPMSKRLSDWFIAHFNCGISVVPNAQGVRFLIPRYPGSDDLIEFVERTLVSYKVGGSIIWLAARGYNLMLEYVLDLNGVIGEDGGVVQLPEHTVAPGMRFAFTQNGIQIVPGLAIPVRYSGHAIHAGAFLYLSFEGPF